MGAIAKIVCVPFLGGARHFSAIRSVSSSSFLLGKGKRHNSIPITLVWDGASPFFFSFSITDAACSAALEEEVILAKKTSALCRYLSSHGREHIACNLPFDHLQRMC